jgi:hypothetical protein
LNVWYDIVLIPVLFIQQLRNISQTTTMLVLILLILFEILRIFLHSSHWTGDIPVYVAFILMTIVPSLVLDVIWIIVVETRTPFDILCMIGFLVHHVLEIIFCVPVYRSFRRYQDGFYQFAQGKSGPDQVNLIE